MDNNQIADLFNAKYANNKNVFGQEPVSLVVKASKLILSLKEDDTPPVALDLGVGNGRNAIYLLSQGFEVTGIDISSQALEILKERAKDYSAKLHVFNGSVLDFPFIADYDLIIGIGLLHFLTEDQCDTLVSRVKEHTKLNGINVWIARMQQNMRNNLKFVFPPGKLQSYYEDLHDWKIVYYKEDGLRTYIIAQKVG